MKGYFRISKAAFYASGGFASPRLVRVTRGRVGRWAYFCRRD